MAMSGVAQPDLPKLENFQWDEMKLPDLSGKNVLVTGGNSGIGYACCLALAKQNAVVDVTAHLTGSAEDLGEPGKDRPTTFESAAGSGVVVAVHKKAK